MPTVAPRPRNHSVSRQGPPSFRIFQLLSTFLEHEPCSNAPKPLPSTSTALMQPAAATPRASLRQVFPEIVCCPRSCRKYKQPLAGLRSQRLEQNKALARATLRIPSASPAPSTLRSLEDSTRGPEPPCNEADHGMATKMSAETSPRLTTL